MNIIHFGDIHVWRSPIALYDPLYLKRYIGGVNLLTKRRRHFPKHIGAQVIDHIVEQEADLVVFSGDMTTASLKSEFKRAAELFEPIREKWGDRFFVIPGNHDRYTKKSVRDDWYGHYFPYGKIDGVRSIELDATTVVVGYDASRAFLVRSNGYFSKALAQQLDEELEKHKRKRVILVGHYPVDYPESVRAARQHEMKHRDRLRVIMEKHKPALYLHGHKHIRWRLGNAVNCGAAGMVSRDPYKMAGFVDVTLGESIEEVMCCHLSSDGALVRKSHQGDF